jgi:hypothetical protein
MQLSDLLIKSKGVPVDWNTTTLEQIGLAYSSHNLNNRKVRDLYNLLKNNYTEIKSILGIGASSIEFSVSDPQLDRTMFLEELGVIAYTEGPGGNPDEPDESMHGLRSWLQRNNITYTDYERRWEEMIFQIDRYDTIVVEDPQLDVCAGPPCAADEINSTHQNILKNWVLAGGLVIEKEEGDWVTIFNMTMHPKWTNENCNSDPAWGTNGTVVSIYDLMNDSLDFGDQICFDEAPGVYNDTGDNFLYRFVEIDDPAIPYGSYAGVGYWNYGSGKIIYMSDTFGLTPVSGTNIRDVINFFNILLSGQEVSGPQHAFSSERLGVVGNRTVSVRVVLWE